MVYKRIDKPPDTYTGSQIEWDLLSPRQQYNKEHAVQISCKERAYCVKNKDHIAARKKKYKDENKDNIRASDKAYLVKNKGRIAVRKKKYNDENKDKIRASNKRRKVKNYERNKINRARPENKAKAKVTLKKWRNDRKEKVKARKAIEKMHILTLKINCKCCTRKFNNQNALQNHMDYVAGIFHNTCEYVDKNGETCGKKFEQASNLVNHRKLHIRDTQRDMAPMEEDQCLETHHTVQSWE